ncbi:nucleotide-diphospho-sugar transferase [Mucilaginibacter aquaedulcis]|uniref:nucleotide-diphospho-sugar transferase n=1 Tax=Mucilaginibacter aquaedulcis TaxID=1187081 RepID=UPI0025B4DF57|nr:nucleotide-diphospho-sugar transferase [Mucilaginibacter aquaedulcis]MDN3547640.1 nucleotide-diphospho-sugar transferase [Mucilaginibacter aquaedulcis]
MISSIPKSELKTPVLLLIFNRPETTKLVFEQIRKVKPSYLYVASDGPRTGNENDKKVVAETRNWVLQNVDWDCQVETLFRSENLGCANAVSSAIDWFFNNVEMGIILEDDCLPDDSFFDFCEELLIKYQYDTRIMHITGTNLLSDYKREADYSYYFSKYANVWGWASWKRAWQKYDLDIKSFSEYREKGYLKDYFSYYPAYVSRLKWYSEVLNIKGDERNFDTWDYQWCFTCSSNSGLSIVPKKNLIKNIGFGGSATHTNVVDKFFSQDTEKMESPLVHPNFVLVDQQHDLVYEKKVFGGNFLAFKTILIDFLRKIILKRKVSYLKYL